MHKSSFFHIHPVHRIISMHAILHTHTHTQFVDYPRKAHCNLKRHMQKTLVYISTTAIESTISHEFSRDAVNLFTEQLTVVIVMYQANFTHVYAILVPLRTKQS